MALIGGKMMTYKTEALHEIQSLYFGDKKKAKLSLEDIDNILRSVYAGIAEELALALQNGVGDDLKLHQHILAIMADLNGMSDLAQNIREYRPCKPPKQ